VEGDRGIRLPNGLYLRYPNLRTVINEETRRDEYVYDVKRGKALKENRIYGGKVVENICQAIARIVIGEQLLRVSKDYKIVMTVHDAIGCVVPEAGAEQAMINIENAMKIRPVWAAELPLDCEGGLGSSYGKCNA